MASILSKYKPGAPKWVLIFAGASLWGFASYRILSMGITLIEKQSINHVLHYAIGISGFIPFFLFIFLKVSRKYIYRIKNLTQTRPCVFAFFDIRGYIIMSGMIIMGILFSHWNLIPELYKGIFFISLGLSLLASSILYIYEGFTFINSTKKRVNP